MPYSYYGRSSLYEVLSGATFDTCPVGSRSAVCIQEETEGAGVPGVAVLESFHNVFPLAESEDSTVKDILILIAIGLVYKILYTVGVVIKTQQTAKIKQANPSSTAVYTSNKDSIEAERRQHQSPVTSMCMILSEHTQQGTTIPELVVVPEGNYYLVYRDMSGMITEVEV